MEATDRQTSLLGKFPHDMYIATEVRVIRFGQKEAEGCEGPTEGV